MPGNRRSDRRRGQGGGPAQKAAFPEGGLERQDARAERTAVFGKTKMCKFFILGVCAKGSDCAFAHDACEMQPAPDLSRTKICKTLINTGTCNDPECTYAHNKEELRDVEGVPPQLPREFRGPDAAIGGGGGHKANANAALYPPPGPPFNLMAGGMPAMPPGQSLDASQALAFQQFMSTMAMQMAQMQMAGAQSQDAQARAAFAGYPGAQAQLRGAPAGQDFLYNALFNNAGNFPGALEQHGAGHAMGISGPPQSSSSASPKRGVRNANKASKIKAQSSFPIQNSAGRCDSCGAEFVPDSKFCRACGRRRNVDFASDPTKPVAYSVKNTFIDVEEPPSTSPLGGLGMRSVQSASARLYAIGGDSTPQQSAKDDDAMSPMLPACPPFPGREDGLTSAFGSGSNIKQMGADSILGEDSPGLNLPAMYRQNTFGSDLAALDEEEEDNDASPMVTQPANAHGGAGFLGGFSSSSEKRVQDTPFGDDGLSDEGGEDANGSREREGSDMSAMENVVIKNTFLEYKQQPTGGMRQVQTASGRLDLMGND